MIKRDKDLLLTFFAHENNVEALKIAMLEHFPELQAKVITTGIDSIYKDITGSQIEETTRAIF